MFFPYLFCKEANKNKILPNLPPFADYLPDGMKLDKYAIFQQWYDKNYQTPFCLKTSLAEYCENDTLILLKAMVAMRRIILDITGGYDVLPKARSIAGLALNVYQKCFLTTDTIALIPDGGYEKWDKSSDKSLKLMNWISKKRQINVQHAGNGREFKISQYKVDGYIQKENKVLEFLGCYYHSHPDCVEPDDRAPNGKPNSINYDDTMKRLKDIKEMGYTVEVFWECEVDKHLKENEVMYVFFNDCETQGSISFYIIQNFYYKFV
jgi:G:T-mismatch repair DNA endonuclease (very short patch repair protein)